MDLFSVILIAVGLSMDAFAAAVVSGVIIRQPSIRQALIIALYFGGFQALMPVVGWYLGNIVSTWLCHVDHWVAFVLLVMVGVKMIRGGISESESSLDFNPLHLTVLLTLSIATSIDAAAVGLSFACLEMSIVRPIIIIGLTTFVFSIVGVFIGDRVGRLFGKRVEILGGLLLLVIGVRILVEHLG
jgi:putative Mn2+ efflux pump MntP